MRNDKTYFEDLNKQTKNFIAKTLVEHFENARKPDVFSGRWQDPYNAEVEEIECHSRDGFIAFDHNRGGYMIKGFCTLMDIYGSGYFPSHKAVEAELQKQIEYNFDYVAEATFEKFEDVFKKHGLTKEDAYYHKLTKLGLDDHPDFKEVLEYDGDYGAKSQAIEQYFSCTVL